MSESKEFFKRLGYYLLIMPIIFYTIVFFLLGILDYTINYFLVILSLIPLFLYIIVFFGVMLEIIYRKEKQCQLYEHLESSYNHINFAKKIKQEREQEKRLKHQA